MAEGDESGKDKETGAGSGTTGQDSPRFAILAQYLKDVSFENPRAVERLRQAEEPQGNMKVDVQVQRLGETEYEVALRLRADIQAQGQLGSVVEIVYCGLFGLANIRQDVMEPLLLVEGPRLLFPFARQIMTDLVREGNLPLPILQPIDFLALYQEQKRRASAAGPAVGNA